MRKLAYLITLSLLPWISAAGQEARTSADVTFSYSYIRANPATVGSPSFNVNGGTADVALNPTGWLGLVGNFGGYHMDGQDSNLGTFLFGPRVYWPRFSRFTPFAEGLFGLAHTTGAGFGFPPSKNSFAMAPGGGVDFAATKRITLRLGEVNYLMTNFQELPGVGRQVQNNFRVSSGIQFRF